MRIENLGRINLIVVGGLMAMVATSQTWDKFLAPGFTYRMELDLSTPRIIHAVRYSPQSKDVWAKPELGGLKVYGEDPYKGRQTISELVKQTGAIGGINADFFPFTGDPLGLMIRDGELVSAPWPKRAVFAWGKKGSAGAIAALTLKGQNGALGALDIDGLNQECGPNNVVFNTPVAGLAISKGEATHIVLKKTSGDFRANSKWSGIVEQIVRAERVPVPEDGAVLTSTGSKGPNLGEIHLGDSVTVEADTGGLDCTKFDQAVGGGPFLVRQGRIAIDWDYEGFNSAFALKRHPRTAVGRTRGGDIWFVAVDGRQEIGDGATLEEMARIMIRYGCVESVNLDGGGSTTFNLFGTTLNRPSDGKERPIANGVLFFGTPAAGSPGGIAIKTPSAVFRDEPQLLKVFTSAGAPTSNVNVIWKAIGAAWIDQGGMLRPTGLGVARITAWSEGRSASAEVTVSERPKPPAKPSKKKRKRKTSKSGRPQN